MTLKFIYKVVYIAMLIRNIQRSRILSLLRKPECNAWNITFIRSHPEYKIIRALPTASVSYFCFALISFIKMAEAQQQQKVQQEINISGMIRQADELFLLGKYEESQKLLEPYQNSNNVEVLWRMARTLYNLSKAKGIKPSVNASLITEAYTYIEKALKLNKEHFAVHKWMAIIYDAKSALKGTKARIKALPVFKKHLMKAIELNPRDATSIYMLGQYMYHLADMSWLQKTLAKTLFEAPPEATFEEAFYYFSKAEEVDPNFYSANLLMLGKTCLKLKKTEAGCYWLRCATAYPVRTDEDEAVRQEAEILLQKYPQVKLSEKPEGALSSEIKK